MYLTRSQYTATQSVPLQSLATPFIIPKPNKVLSATISSKEDVEKGIINLDFVGTKYQLADLFTKALPPSRFVDLVHHIGMRCLTPDDLLNFLKT
jgi:hypothetical protein